MPSSQAVIGFWRWFARGSGGRSGLQRLLNCWLLLHVVIGIVLAWLVPRSIEQAAQSVLLPLVGVLVGLTFAWIGNAYAVLQTPEIEDLSSHLPGGMSDYVHTFQLAVLLLLVASVLWGAAGLGVFDRPCLFNCPTWTYFACKASLFAIASLGTRECWHVVTGAQLLLLIRSRIRKHNSGSGS